ncbi:MAG: hypothetical protein M3Y22_00105 [Pseudomonadota bacterium]|nr:hypothetical protein [Pseudomonadota bacterium]
MIDPDTDRVLITGAAGAIGTAPRDGLRAKWRHLRLTDILPVQNVTGNEEAIVADIADCAAIEAMMRDVQAIVHLAGVLGNYDLEERCCTDQPIGRNTAARARRTDRDDRRVARREQQTASAAASVEASQRRLAADAWGGIIPLRGKEQAAPL